MNEPWTPILRLHEIGGRCRLSLDGVTCGQGRTLQDAADDLVGRLLHIALAVSRSGCNVPASLGPPDLRVLAFIHEIGQLAARGGDVRERLFGSCDDQLAA